MRQSLYDYCTANKKEYLLQEWDSDKNLPATPETVSYGSKQRLWWRCESGHSWQTAVYTRTAGTGCPYCTGRKIEVGENDLKSLFPDLAAQWHPVKNGELSPSQFTAGSNRKIWWRCENGHEWQASIKSRSYGTGCPYCANRLIVPGENDLETTNPELIPEWHNEKNLPLTPRELTSGSHKKVWWRCEKGHEWQAAVLSRSRGIGCPVCAGKLVVPEENDLASRHPDIAAQWHSTKNGNLTPEGCTSSSNRRVWWLCPLGHEYQAVIGSRTVHGSGCPYCSGRKVLKDFNDLAALEPKIAAQWHPTLNGTLTPEMVTVGSTRKVWWQCDEGHAWKAVIYSRTGAEKCGCPVCAGRVKVLRHEKYAALRSHAAQDRTIAISARGGTMPQTHG